MSSSPDRLVYMANQIGKFFSTQGPEKTVAGVSDHIRKFKAGEEVARRVAVLFVEVTPKETSALARSCRIEVKPGGQVLHFKQAGGKDAEVPLL